MIVNQKELPNANLDELSATQVFAGEIIIGTLTGLDVGGQALVDFPGNIAEKAISAISTVSVLQKNAGRQVALLFSDNDIEKPIIIGFIHNPFEDILDNYDTSKSNEPITEMADSQHESQENLQLSQKTDDVLIEGDRVVFEANKEIVLKCGESSITLTKSGKILIRGKYLLNRSSGVNRIMGGSVQIN